MLHWDTMLFHNGIGVKHKLEWLHIVAPVVEPTSQLLSQALKQKMPHTVAYLLDRRSHPSTTEKSIPLFELLISEHQTTLEQIFKDITVYENVDLGFLDWILYIALYESRFNLFDSIHH